MRSEGEKREAAHLTAEKYFSGPAGFQNGRKSFEAPLIERKKAPPAEVFVFSRSKSADRGAFPAAKARAERPRLFIEFLR